MRKIRHIGILWMLLLISPVSSIAQGEYKMVDSRLKGDIEVGSIVGTDKKGELKRILIPRSEILKHLTDTSTLEKKPPEQLPSYSQRGSDRRTKGNIKIPYIDLALEHFDIKGDSINLLKLHKESLSKGEYAGFLLKKDANTMNVIKDFLKESIGDYDRISLVTSLIYADSGIVQTDRQKGAKLELTGKWTALADSAKAGLSYTDTTENGLIVMKLIAGSPALYSGTVIFEKNRYNYKAFIPFGIDNILDKQYAKGVSCLLLEATGIGGFFYFKSEQNKYTDYTKKTQNDDKKKEYMRKAERYEYAKYGSIVVGTALVYVLWDFLCDFSPSKKNKSPEYHTNNRFQISPYTTIEDSGLVLSFNF
jgi:hypothetical protein